MKYVLLIVNAEDDFMQLPADEQQKVIDHMNAFSDELKSSGTFVACGGLAPASEAKTVRLTGAGRQVADGVATPPDDSKRLVTGFFVIDASSIDEAVAWANKMPIVAGGIEIRPIAVE